MLKRGPHIIRISTLVINPRLLVISHHINLIIRLIPPMVRILQDRTNGGRFMLNQDGVQVQVLIGDVAFLLILSYLSSPRWSYRMYPS